MTLRELLVFPAARGLLRWLLALLFDVEVRGLPRVPASSYILIANHLNWVDGFLLLAALPAKPRLYILADRDAIDRIWWRRLVANLVGRVVLIKRVEGHSDLAALRKAHRILERGNALALFPEGKVGQQEGCVGPLQRGVGALYLRSGAPVLPVGLAGVSDLYLGRRLTVAIGQPTRPVIPAGSTRSKIDSIAAQLQTTLDATLPVYREIPVTQKRMRWLTGLLD